MRENSVFYIDSRSNALLKSRMTYRLLPLLLCAFVCTGRAQDAVVPPPAEPTLGERWIALEGGDSVLVWTALPAVQQDRPAVLVLHDRFGPHTHVRSVMKVLATVGYRAFALPLLSAPEQPARGYPPVTIDSSDFARVTQVAVELMNDEGCTGRIGLLGFDVGAQVVAETIARLPFFKAAVLFYPSGGTGTLVRLLDSATPTMIVIAQYDADCTLADVNAIREIFMEQKRKLHVSYVKDAHRFFFNPDHERYHVPAMKLAWKELVAFFNRRL